MNTLTIGDVIEKVGLEKFKEYGKGWYNLDCVLDNTNTKADRYAIYGFMPFYFINQKYNESYEKDNDIGSTYDWLNDYPNEVEVEWFNSKVF